MSLSNPPPPTPRCQFISKNSDPHTRWCAWLVTKEWMTYTLQRGEQMDNLQSLGIWWDCTAGGLSVCKSFFGLTSAQPDQMHTFHLSHRTKDL